MVSVGQKIKFTAWLLFYVRINYWIRLNSVFLPFHYYLRTIPTHMANDDVQGKISERHNSSVILIVTGQVMTWCGGLTMPWCPKFTAGVQAQCARWEVGVITSPWDLNSKIISFHLQMRRRSKPDQIEERRSVSSVWAGKNTHGSGTTHCRRVEMRFECLFLLVQVCLYWLYSHIHMAGGSMLSWWWATLESILH